MSFLIDVSVQVIAVILGSGLTLWIASKLWKIQLKDTNIVEEERQHLIRQNTLDFVTEYLKNTCLDIATEIVEITAWDRSNSIPTDYFKGVMPIIMKISGSIIPASIYIKLSKCQDKIALLNSESYTFQDEDIELIGDKSLHIKYLIYSSERTINLILEVINDICDELILPDISKQRFDRAQFNKRMSNIIMGEFDPNLINENRIMFDYLWSSFDLPKLPTPPL